MKTVLILLCVRPYALHKYAFVWLTLQAELQVCDLHSGDPSSAGCIQVIEGGLCCSVGRIGRPSLSRHLLTGAESSHGRAAKPYTRKLAYTGRERTAFLAEEKTEAGRARDSKLEVASRAVPSPAGRPYRDKRVEVNYSSAQNQPARRAGKARNSDSNMLPFPMGPDPILKFEMPGGGKND